MAYEQYSPELRRSLLLADYLIELYDQGIVKAEDSVEETVFPQLKKDLEFIKKDMKEKRLV